MQFTEGVHYAVDPATGCWEWLKCRTRGGYGMLRFQGRSQLAHRVAKGVPPGRHWGVVMHTCDNPGCVNPAHLVVGTAKDNMVDKVNKGRWSGRKQQLTPLDILDILTSPLSGVDLAAKYGVSTTTISKVRTGTYRTRAGVAP